MRGQEFRVSPKEVRIGHKVRNDTTRNRRETCMFIPFLFYIRLLVQVIQNKGKLSNIKQKTFRETETRKVDIIYKQRKQELRVKELRISSSRQRFQRKGSRYESEEIKTDENVRSSINNTE